MDNLPVIGGLVQCIDARTFEGILVEGEVYTVSAHCPPCESAFFNGEEVEVAHSIQLEGVHHPDWDWPHFEPEMCGFNILRFVDVTPSNYTPEQSGDDANDI